MRRLFIGSASLALGLALAITPASAQFAIGGGITSPSGDDGFGAEAKTGWMASAAWSPWQNDDGSIRVWIEGLYGSNNAVDGSDTELRIFRCRIAIGIGNGFVVDRCDGK